MKTHLLENDELRISDIDFIPVDDSQYGKDRKQREETTMIDFYSLIALAKKHGFDLPADAFIHNYECWRVDFKSNYHHNGVNCFTPCGCNELAFTLYKGEGETYCA